MTTITVSKVSVKYVQPKLWTVTLNLLIEEDSVEIFNQNFSAPYRQGETLTAMTDKFLVPMQAAIDIYKDEQTKENLAQWTGFLGDLQAALVY